MLTILSWNLVPLLNAKIYSHSWSDSSSLAAFDESAFTGISDCWLWRSRSSGVDIRNIDVWITPWNFDWIICYRSTDTRHGQNELDFTFKEILSENYISKCFRNRVGNMQSSNFIYWFDISNHHHPHIA